MTEKLPIGTRVRYHGSLAYYRTRTAYVIDGYSDLSLRKDLPAAVIAEKYPDGVAYNLWPLDEDGEPLPRRFGNRDYAVFFVRPSSVTPLEDHE